MRVCSLSNGIYFVFAQSGEKSFIKKIVIEC